MTKHDKLLDAMRRNPHGDWTISDIERVCRPCGIAVMPPKRGDHYKLAHAARAEILTVPAHRPIRAVYIRAVIDMIDDVQRTLREED